MLIYRLSARYSHCALKIGIYNFAAKHLNQIKVTFKNLSSATALILWLCMAIAVSISNAQIHETGAQVWLEPGQNEKDIDLWFERLKQHNMRCTRIFMQWNFIETAPDKWDFGVFDAAFASAERHGVKIVGTLMPNFPPAHKGGWYKTQDGAIAKTQQQLDDSRIYIAKVVNRYKSHPALHTWMLMNEPGQFPAPDTLAMQRFREYLRTTYKSIDVLNRAWLANFASFETISYSPNWAGGGFTWPTSYIDWNTFWREHLGWYLEQIALEIKKHDTKHEIHVNPHALLDILPKYDLPSWRKFLSHLGASIHPVWHFNDLKRHQYPFGVAWVGDLVAGAAEPNPFWTTELQGGHNIYSADQNIQPTADETAAWLWASIGSGAEKTIFWCLNPRNMGTEAGEWAMLDFQNNASDRLKTAGQIAGIVESNSSFFNGAKALKDEVAVILSLETLTLQERARKTYQNHLGKGHKTHYFATLACYRALQQQGFHPKVKHIHDYDWLAKSAQPRVAILADAEALTDAQIEQLQGYVANGNHLIIMGNTGFFDEKEGARPHTGRFFNKLVGGQLKELINASEVQLNLKNNYKLPVAGYGGAIVPENGKIISNTKGEPTALINHLGKGTVFWCPYKIDVAAWFEPTNTFNTFLNECVSDKIKAVSPIQFEANKNLIIRTLQNGKNYVTICSRFEPNATVSRDSNTFQIKTTGSFDAKVIFGDASALSKNLQKLNLANNKTVVILWSPKP
jgi:beta-galactosidase